MAADMRAAKRRAVGSLDERLTGLSRLLGEIDAPSAPVDRLQRDLRGAVLSCLFCKRGTDCAKFLGSPRAPGEPPAFCPNRARLLRLAGRAGP